MITSTVRYDLLKELAVATTVVLVVVLALAGLLSSANVPPLTIQNWAQDDAVRLRDDHDDRVGRDSTSAHYGAPYNAGGASVQQSGPLAPQDWAGVRLPVNSANDFVLAPLKYASVGNPELATALATYAASDAQRLRRCRLMRRPLSPTPRPAPPSAHASLSEHRFETRTGNAGIAHVDQGLGFCGRRTLSKADEHEAATEKLRAATEEVQ